MVLIAPCHLDSLMLHIFPIFPDCVECKQKTECCPVKSLKRDSKRRIQAGQVENSATSNQHEQATA